MPAQWTAAPGDTHFLVDPGPSGNDGPATIIGVGTLGQERIEPGDYTIAVVLTSQSDVATPPPTARLGCSSQVRIPKGTHVIAIDITFGGAGCRITATERLTAGE